MKHKKVAVAAIAVMLMAVGAGAQSEAIDWTHGNGLLDGCTQFDLHNDATGSVPLSSFGNASFCSGYVRGVTESLQALHHACVPHEVTTLQSVDIVVNYLKTHPEVRHHLSWNLIQTAITQAWPCTK